MIKLMVQFQHWLLDFYGLVASNGLNGQLGKNKWDFLVLSKKMWFLVVGCCFAELLVEL